MQYSDSNLEVEHTFVSVAAASRQAWFALTLLLSHTPYSHALFVTS